MCEQFQILAKKLISDIRNHHVLLVFLIPNVVLFFPPSLQTLPTEIQRVSVVSSRAALPPLSLRLPGLNDYLQVVSIQSPGLQSGSQHPHPLHQYVRHAGEGHHSSVPRTGTCAQ